jgi:uncharacterized protein (UPF0332 family)
MGLFERSTENKKAAQKCLDIRAFDAGINRAYYSAFQMAMYCLENNPLFDYDKFLEKHKIDKIYIPHGKVKLALAECLVKCGKTINLNELWLFSNLYEKRRLADYTDKMFNKNELQSCLNDLDVILAMTFQLLELSGGNRE